MKRFGNLWSQVIAFENLLQAARQAQKGKRYKQSVLSFNHRLEDELHQLQEELSNQTYTPGDYHSFRIYDPKPRLISAAPYRDRVVHHALCNVITPLIEPTFITTSYANRVGYGSHKALHKFIQYFRTSRYVLQCDIRKYFPSIDHKMLKSLLRRKLKCPKTLELIDLIIDGSNDQDPSLEYFPGDDLLAPAMRRKGLPIGNLTSQFFANVYLNGFDHFIKETLLCRKYLRYVDDFALFSDDKDYLSSCRDQLEDYLATLRLKIHPIKSQLFETNYGANFVGFRIVPLNCDLPHKVRIRVRNDNLRRSRHRLREYQRDCANGVINLEELIQRLQSWEAHLYHGNTYGLRRSLFDSWSFRMNAELDKA